MSAKGIAMEGISMQKTVLKLTGLDCGDCARKLEKSVAQYPGVTKASLNFAVGKMDIEHGNNINELISLIKSHGYGAVVEKEFGAKQETSSWYKDNRLVLTIISGLFIVLAIFSQYFLQTQTLSVYFYLASILIGGFYIGRSAINSLKTFNLDMNVLMSLAVIGAIFLGEWLEGASVIFLFSVGNTLQYKTIEKTRNSITQLMKLAPEEAIILKSGKEITVPLSQIEIGDIVIIRPGDRFPVDGTVVQGITTVDQSPITGESTPLEKEVGNHVFAGTVNIDGYIQISADKVVADSTLAKIIHLVEDAQNEKAPVQQMVDRFANYYTPVVIIGALLLTIIPTFVLGLPFNQWFYSSLVLLVIACPCALVISTPVSIAAAIGNAARNGILIKGGSYIELIGTIKGIAFDKTGTLTKGTPKVKDIILFGETNENELLTIAASIEKMANHPLGTAIIQEAEKRNLTLETISDFKNIPGKGASGAKDQGTEKTVFYAGNSKLFSEIMEPSIYQSYFSKIEKNVLTGSLVIIGTSKLILGLISFEDSIRENAADSVNKLKKLGLEKVVMLTGDHYQSASKIAGEIGIDYKAELLPQEKLNQIKELAAHGKVAMVGDGINDAPALAIADIGIAMGAIGTDTAIETADVALMTDDLSKLPYLVRLSQRTNKIIKENISFSLIVKAIFIVLALSGNATLWMAIFADTGAALLVTINGMRLARRNNNLETI